MGVKVVKLEDVCEFYRGLTYSKKDEATFSDKIVLRASNIDLDSSTLVLDDLKYLKEDFVIPNDKKLQKDCIFICMSSGSKSHLGKVAYIDRDYDYAFGGFMGLIKPKTNILPRYLFYLLQTPEYKELIKKLSNGININNIKFSDLKEFQFELPSLEEQGKILNTLDKADEIRAKKKLANDKLDKFLKSTFISMFGTPIANEKHWEVKKLKELTTKIMSGNTPKGGSQVYVPSGIEFYRSQNVWKNRIEKDDIAYIDEATHKKMERSSLKHNDILITKTGRINTENSSLGRSALYEGEDDKANINGHVYLVRLKEGMCHRFILTILTSNEYREHIRSVCVGGIDKRQLNKEHIEDFPIIYPPIEDQNKFAQIVEKVEAQKQKNELVIEQMNNLFNSLSQKAFKGEL